MLASGHVPSRHRVSTRTQVSGRFDPLVHGTYDHVDGPPYRPLATVGIVAGHRVRCPRALIPVPVTGPH